MKYLLLLGIIVSISCYASDTIYQYKDKNGATVFTNKPVKNGKKVVLPAITVYAAPMTQSDFKAKGYTNSTTAKNAIQDSAIKKNYTQSINQNLGTNEVGRQQILNEELALEQKALTDSQQALQSGMATKLPSEQNNPEQYQARIKALRDAVTEHQKNIDILSNQLGIKH
ncbi:MAG: DUF4124 domain-containing protein [Neisseriaceae bacterium]|nr:MAG: DUF4124 domain-containing protein [Neisseriaceae bacterium]